MGIYRTTPEGMARALAILKEIGSRVKPPPKLTVSEWAERFRVLSSETSAQPGKWRNAVVPYLVEVQDTLSPGSGIEKTVCMFSSQTGKTEILNNFCGYIIDQDPGPMLIVQPNDRMLRTWSTKRLAPMLRDTPTLRNKVSEARSRDSGNRIDEKSFPGGYLAIVSSNSAAGLASRPCRYALFDEIDRYQATTEGNAVQLGSKRTVSFPNRKILLVSSPSFEDIGIDAEYKASDQRKFNVPCPHCDELQVLEWKNLIWEAEQPETAKYGCQHCGTLIDGKHKRWMLARGEWIAAFPDEGRSAGFWLNQLYSPFRSWGETACEFWGVRKDPEKLQAFVNTALSECWREPAEILEYDTLMARREDYSLPIPQGVVAITVGCDVQGDRIEALTLGWGVDEECWVLDWRTIAGDPSKRPIWLDVDAYLQTTFEHESGVRLRVAACCLDTGGHHTDMAYRFCKSRYDEHIYAIKGSSQPGRPIAPQRPSTKNKGKVPLFSLGTDTAKQQIYRRLRSPEMGGGYVHFPQSLDAEFFEQLTSERLVTRYRRGFEVRTWEKKAGVRNEVLDMFVYATAALGIRGLNLRSLDEQLRQRTETPLHEQQPKAINRRGRRTYSTGV